MQQFIKKIKKNSLTGLIGLAWVAGLLLAGSDGEYMPWINGFGVLLFLLASILLGRQLTSADHKAKNNVSSIARLRTDKDWPKIRLSKTILQPAD